MDKIKNFLSLLLIILPALIILMGIIRLFLTKGKGIVNGFSMLFAILALLAAIVRYNLPDPKPCPSEPGPPPLSVGKHSDNFNGSLQTMMDAYVTMKDAFVKKDIGLINQSGQTLKTAIDSLKIDELKKDTTGIYESALDPLAFSKDGVTKLMAAATLAEKLAVFNEVSGNIQLLLSIVQFNEEMIYLHECPVAFGENTGGFWLSRVKEEDNNPYGKDDCSEFRKNISDTSKRKKEVVNDSIPKTTGNKQ
ncbi:MAG TPA: hypothetical protein VHM26_16345 [Chitinophagaceae bacterium]|jgi:Cu(I)/Ag(I) efflux system membrane fusion protein|nr:hypothetical protein [Chitinophagaceae bacterium]